MAHDLDSLLGRLEPSGSAFADAVEAIAAAARPRSVASAHGSPSFAAGVPHVVGRHAHPMVKAETAPPPEATGIDYLGLIEARHAAELAACIDYSGLPRASPAITDRSETP